MEILAPVQGKNIAIIAACGGRNLLYQELRKNNRVEYVFSYERFNPSCDFGLEELALKPWQEISAVFISSEQTLHNLRSTLPSALFELLKSQAVLVSLSERISASAREIGFSSIITAAQATEEAQIRSFAEFLTSN